LSNQIYDIFKMGLLGPIFEQNNYFQKYYWLLVVGMLCLPSLFIMKWSNGCRLFEGLHGITIFHLTEFSKALQPINFHGQKLF